MNKNFIIPIACESDLNTMVGEENGPNVITGNEAAAVTNLIVPSFRKSI